MFTQWNCQMRAKLQGKGSSIINIEPLVYKWKRSAKKHTLWKEKKNRCKLNNVISYWQGQSSDARNPRLGNRFGKKKKMTELENLKGKFNEIKKNSVRDCLGVWLRLFFQIFFVWKCIKIIFFSFLKFIFFTLVYQNSPKDKKNNNLKLWSK